MFELVNSHFKEADVSIFSAAVSDYKASVIKKGKIKKSDQEINLSLVNNIDILSEISLKKSSKQFLVGFALETDNELENAKIKLKNKNLDMIILNSLNDKGAGFEYDTNKITIIDKKENISNFELKEKSEVARDIVLKIIELQEC